MSIPERIDDVSGPGASTGRGARRRATLPAQASTLVAVGPAGATPTRADSWPLVRHLFASHPLPRLVYDVEALTVLDANDAMLVSYGYTREELLGMHITRR